MKLSLIYEAEMSRRGFLKMLGKAAVAASSGPDVLGFLGNLPNLPSHYMRFISAYRNANISDESIQEAITNALNGHEVKFVHSIKKMVPEPLYWAGKYQYTIEVPKYIDHEIDPKIVKGFILDKTLKNNDLSNWIGGENIGSVNKVLDGLLGEVFDIVVGRIGPKKVIQQLMANHNFDTAMYGVHEIMDLSKVFKNFMSKIGITGEKWESLRNNLDSDLLEKLDFIDPEKIKAEKLKIQQRKQHAKELAEKRKKAMEEWHRNMEEYAQKEKERIEKERIRKAREKLQSKKSGREVGYKRQTHFDPISNRLAQALGPFESKLKNALAKI